MFCPKCGTELSASANFCKNCGIAITKKSASNSTSITLDIKNKQKNEFLSENPKLTSNKSVDKRPFFKNLSSSQKFILLGIALSIVFILYLGLSKDKDASEIKDTKKSYSSSDIRGTLKQGVEYTYWPGGNAAGTAVSTEKEIYLSLQDYEKLCKANEGFTKLGAASLTTLDPKARSLFFEGNTDELASNWTSNTSYTYRCRATLTVSGMYNGSSARVHINGGITGFILNNENKILVRAADSMSN